MSEGLLTCPRHAQRYHPRGRCPDCANDSGYNQGSLMDRAEIRNLAEAALAKPTPDGRVDMATDWLARVHADRTALARAVLELLDGDGSEECVTLPRHVASFLLGLLRTHWPHAKPGSLVRDLDAALWEQLSKKPEWVTAIGTEILAAVILPNAPDEPDAPPPPEEKPRTFQGHPIKYAEPLPPGPMKPEEKP